MCDCETERTTHHRRLSIFMCLTVAIDNNHYLSSGIMRSFNFALKIRKKIYIFFSMFYFRAFIFYVYHCMLFL